jgi:hypothetical protein
VTISEMPEVTEVAVVAAAAVLRFSEAPELMTDDVADKEEELP